MFCVSATALNKSAMLQITVCCDLTRVRRKEFASLRTASQREGAAKVRIPRSKWMGKGGGGLRGDVRVLKRRSTP